AEGDEAGNGGGDEAGEAEGDEAGNGGGDEAEGDGDEAGEAGNGGGNKAIPVVLGDQPPEKKKDLLEVVQSFHPEASVRLNVSTLLCLWWGEKRRPQAVGDTAAKQDNGAAAHSPDLLRPKSAFQAELQQATIGGDEAANRLSEFLLQQAPTDLKRIQVLEAGLARQKVSSWRFLDLSTPSEFHLPPAVEEAPADVVMQEHQDGPAPKRPRRNYLQEATRALTGSSVGVREVQDEKSLCISKVLYEPINREAIEELAETRAAAQLGLRTDLAILLIRDKDALGLVASTYKESAAAQDLFDRPGRLYTGHHNNLYKGLMQELKKLEMQDQDNSDAIDKLLERILPTVFDGLDKLGIDSYRASASTFRFKKEIKELCRLDCDCLDLHQVCSAAHILLQRHPDAKLVRYYVEHREEILAETGGPRASAKELFNQIFFGGGEPILAEFAVPDFARQLVAEMRILRKKDEAAYNPQMQMCRTRFPGASLQAYLHQLKEREISEAVVKAVAATGVATIASWEHNGVVFVPCGRHRGSKAWRETALAAAREAAAPFPITEKQYRTKEDELCRVQLGGYLSAGKDGVDMPVVKLLPGHVQANGLCVRDSYKTVATSKTHVEVAFFNEEVGRWELCNSKHSEMQLAKIATATICSALPPFYTGLPPKWSQQSATMKGIARSAMMDSLYNKDFFIKLDAGDAMNFIVFSDGTVVNVNGERTKARRDLLISHSMGIPYPEEIFANPPMDVVSVLEQVRDYEATLNLDYGPEDALPDEVQAGLEEIMNTPEFVSLRMLYRSQENWEIVLLLLKDAALRLFGCQFLEQAFIWVGGGKNGKGAWWSALEYVMGSYAKGIPKELLTSASMPAETAAPLKMSLRGRRYLMIPELDHKTKVQSTTFKDFRDPASTISARTLYGDIVPFKVSWGKGPPLTPHERPVDTAFKSPKMAEKMAPGLCYLLFQVFKVFGDAQGPAGAGRGRAVDTMLHPQPYAVVRETQLFLNTADVPTTEIFLRPYTILPNSGQECPGFDRVRRAWHAYAEPVLGKTEAKSVWRDTFVAHKYCGRYIAKLRPSGSFVGPAESEP
ncbi:unnamed protein product, partial [Effrenium voratum]